MQGNKYTDEGGRHRSDETKLSYVAGACISYCFGVVGCVIAIRYSPPDMMAMVVGGAIAFMSGAGMKVINIFQNRHTDKKVTEDVEKTREVEKKVDSVHNLVNGGLEDRIAKAVKAAMEEREKKP